MSLKNLLVESIRDFVVQKAKNNDNFKRWFGNSIVVDDNGDPTVVYHGTRYNFDEFKKTNDLGFHFGTVTSANKILGRPSDIKDNVGRYFDIDITEAILPNKEEFFEDLEGFISELEDDIEVEYDIEDALYRSQSYFESSGEEYSEEKLVMKMLEYTDPEILESIGIVAKAKDTSIGMYFIKLENPLRSKDMVTWYPEDFFNAISYFKDQPEVTKAIVNSKSKDDLRKNFMDLGYDGIIYSNVIEDDGSDSFIVFEAQNIKSVMAQDFNPQSKKVTD